MFSAGMSLAIHVLRVCAGLSNSWLLAEKISATISWAGPFVYICEEWKKIIRLMEARTRVVWMDANALYLSTLEWHDIAFKLLGPLWYFLPGFDIIDVSIVITCIVEYVYPFVFFILSLTSKHACMPWEWLFILRTDYEIGPEESCNSIWHYVIKF